MTTNPHKPVTTETDGHWPFGTTLDGRTVIACECGEKPKAPPARMSMQHVWHGSHRRRLGLQPVEYMWPEERYLVGLSTGPYVQVRGHEWKNGGWVKS
jgi:hypothetical protein